MTQEYLNKPRPSHPSPTDLSYNSESKYRAEQDWLEATTTFNMKSNPYESPQDSDAGRFDERRRALRGIRLAIVILLMPAIYNFVCFETAVASGQSVGAMAGVFRTLNAMGIVLIASASWFFGLAVLELATAFIHWLFARMSALQDWRSVLYRRLRLAPIFAVLGAVLWAIWVAAFYQMKTDFYTISIPIGIIAHLLAAVFYLPLAMQWYQVERF